MEAIHYVIAAGVVVWTGLGVYLFVLGRKQRALSDRLRQLELLQGNTHDQQ